LSSASVARPNVQQETAQDCRVISNQDITNLPGTAIAQTIERLPTSVTTCPPNPPPQAAAGNSTKLSAFDQRILNAQNAARSTAGVPPLQWNLVLAEHAAEYARVLALTGQLVHAPRDGRGTERENLQQGLIGWTPERMVQEWLNEKTLFHPGKFPDICNGDWAQCAHYTQMIWPTTTDVGCGAAQGGGFNWFVCRYSPGGNKDGQMLVDGSQFTTTGRIDHDFKYGLSYRNTPVSSESAYDGGALIDISDPLLSLNNSGFLSVFPVQSTPPDPLDLMDPINWDAPM
jgi:hypothetical protein